MLDAASSQQDLLCRTTGLCLHGAELDRELGDLIPKSAEAGAHRPFSYVRYNHRYSDAEVAAALAQAGGKWDLANLGLIPTAAAAGSAYAAAHVHPDHLR